LLHQRPPNWTLETQTAYRRVGLVRTNEQVFSLLLVFIDAGDGRTEANFIDLALSGTHNHGIVKSSREKADPTIDFSKPLLAVGVLRVFRAVTLSSSICHFRDNLGSLDRSQLPQLRLKRLGAFRGEIVGTRHGKNLLHWK